MLMSNSDSKGNVTFNINWDNVAVFMAKWGYSFTKCAMSKLTSTCTPSQPPSTQ